MKGLISGLTIALVSILIGIASIEIFTRTAIDNGMNFHLEMWKYALYSKRVSKNVRIGHEHVPLSTEQLMGVEIRINANGLRDSDIPYEKPQGVKRILMLGDSVTLGWGVSEQQTVSNRLERTLNEELAIPIEVINGGVGNYNTGMEVAYFFSDGFEYDPDIVILNYFINDAEPTPIYRPLGIFSRLSYGWIFILGSIDTIGRRFFGGQGWKEYYSSLYADDANGWASTQQSIEKLARFCLDRDIRFIIVNYPELRELNRYPFAKINQKLALFANSTGAEYLDLLPAVQPRKPQELWVTPADPHPNAVANELFESYLSRYLLPSLRPANS